jgi:hypothetical protein
MYGLLQQANFQNPIGFALVPPKLAYREFLDLSQSPEMDLSQRLRLKEAVRAKA